MYSSTTINSLLAALSIFAIPSIAIPQSSQPDGTIVPFSTLPQCASLCGKLFDVQGACSPPVMAVSDSCFCNDARLKPFLNAGTAGVSQVCGGQSCQDAASLQQIQNWYQGLCNGKAAANPTTTAGGATTATGTQAGATPTSTSGSSSGSSSGNSSGSLSKNANNGWWQGHWKWVVMLIVIVIAIVGGWVGAAFWRKSYLRKKEREIEMRPPVSWPAPQGTPGAFGYGDGVVDQPGQGYNKEAAGMTPADNTRQSRGWLTKART